MFELRKSSDTVLITSLRWICIMFSILGLLYYLVTLVMAMLTFDYFLQTTEISGLNGFTEMPDVILCTKQASVKVGDWYDEQGLTTDGPQIGLTSRTWVNGGNDTSLPIFSRPACADRHDGITIASFGEQSFNRSSLAALRLIITPNDPASNDVHPVTLRVFPTRNVKLPDIWGLMGMTFSQPQHSISSSFNTFPIPMNESYLNVKVPLTNIEQTQILITTIPSAFSSWGGALSLVTGIFCFCFGSRKLCRPNLPKKFTAWNGDASNDTMADYSSQDAQSDQATSLLEKDHPFVEVIKELYLDMELLNNKISAQGQPQTGNLAV
ncbi:hypothetical protein BG015_008558 [Linnemannia schmuckeri]|uniref:Uncharacterized protein n=1 Tax=Linnemannia schmuckeri TaxID=64567 RepID=A0A9P5S0C7_9FUNG|nr:hypothetical protein BG015_008558 [Linnemannia schmuckeri]